MKKLASILMIALVAVFIFTSCEKEVFEPFNGPNPDPTGSPKLNYSLSTGTKGAMDVKSEIVTGSTISGDMAYFFLFWLEPGTCVGTYVITDDAGNVVYQSASEENSMEFKFTATGTYHLVVSGIYMGSSFLFNNINIIVTGGGIVVTDATAPVRMKSITLSGSNVLISVAINKEELNPVSGTYFYVQRVNGTGFLIGTPVTITGDSAYFTMTIPAATGYFEFNLGRGTMWMTASAIPSGASAPSILYVPSENYFRCNLNVSGTNATVTAPNGTVLLSTTSGGPTTLLPDGGVGQGDEAANFYTVRWLGLDHWFKANDPSIVFRYKIGITGTWIMPTVTSWGYSSLALGNYYGITYPSGISGEIHFEWGTYSGGAWIDDPNVQNSQYYNAAEGHCIINM